MPCRCLKISLLKPHGSACNTMLKQDLYGQPWCHQVRHQVDCQEGARSSMAPSRLHGFIVMRWCITDIATGRTSDVAEVRRATRPCPKLRETMPGRSRTRSEYPILLEVSEGICQKSWPAEDGSFGDRDSYQCHTLSIRPRPICPSVTLQTGKPQACLTQVMFNSVTVRRGRAPNLYCQRTF